MPSSKLKAVSEIVARPERRVPVGISRRTWAVGLLLGGLAGMAYLVLFAALARGNLLFFLDEYHGIRDLDAPWHAVATKFDIWGSGFALPLSQKLALEVFGRELWVYRLPALAGALGSLLIYYATARAFVGTVPALVAFSMFATSHIHIYYSHVGRPYSLTIFFCLATVAALSRILDQERPGMIWYVAFAVSAAMAVYVHLVALPFVLGVSAAAVLVALLSGKTTGRMMVSICGAGLLVLVPYLLAWSSVSELLNRVVQKKSYVSFTSFDILDMLSGSRPLTVVWAVALPVAVVWYATAKRKSALL